MVVLVSFGVSVLVCVGVSVVGDVGNVVGDLGGTVSPQCSSAASPGHSTGHLCLPGLDIGFLLGPFVLLAVDPDLPLAGLK